MRSPFGVSPGLPRGVAPLFTWCRAVSSSHGVSPVDARRDASRVQIRVQPTSPPSDRSNGPRPKKKAATRLTARKDRAVTRTGSAVSPVTEHARVTALLLTLHGRLSVEEPRDRKLERTGTLGTPSSIRCPRKYDSSLQVRCHAGTPGTPGTLSSPGRRLQYLLLDVRRLTPIHHH